tara:strand:+ start:14891 stop:16186 length:1296 start_codon:yes stop_codon:yes gene_type:complete
MKKNILIVGILIFSSTAFSQCYAPTSLSAPSIYFHSAEVSWTPVSPADYFRIRYKEENATSWSFVNNINGSLTSKVLGSLSPLSNYVWQIKAYCDSINTSGWSLTDTFYTTTTQCPTSSMLYTTNITYYNAQANWDTVSGSDRYKIRYKVLGTTNWSNIGPAHHPSNQLMIPLLQQNTTYEWQVMTYHDTTNLLGSLWSQSDTFTTTTFVPSTFNPTVINNLSSLECNQKTNLHMSISQLQDEPDIGSSIITTDGGYFDLNSFSIGDSVGHVTTTTSTQVIEGTLNIGVILGQNYAIVNTYDSTGSLIGFFTLENDGSGVKISSSSPNDGNNYTSGYNSDIYINDLFVNPPVSGPLNFSIDIDSELNDQILLNSSLQIWCGITNLADFKENNKSVVLDVDMLGRKNKNNSIKIITNEIGKTQKIIILNELK